MTIPSLILFGVLVPVFAVIWAAQLFRTLRFPPGVLRRGNPFRGGDR